MCLGYSGTCIPCVVPNRCNRIQICEQVTPGHQLVCLCCISWFSCSSRD